MTTKTATAAFAARARRIGFEAAVAELRAMTPVRLSWQTGGGEFSAGREAAAGSVVVLTAYQQGERGDVVGYLLPGHAMPTGWEENRIGTARYLSHHVPADLRQDAWPERTECVRHMAANGTQTRAAYCDW